MDRGPPEWSSRRRSTAHAATIRLGDGREISVLVTNLSGDGCHLVAEAELAVGDSFELSLPNRDPIAAQVRWTAGNRAGIRFAAGT